MFASTNIARGGGGTVNSLRSGLSKVAAAAGQIVKNALPLAKDVLVDHARQHGKEYFNAFRKGGLKGVFNDVMGNLPGLIGTLTKKAISADPGLVQAMPKELVANASGWPLGMSSGRGPFLVGGANCGHGPFLGHGPFIGRGPFVGGWSFCGFGSAQPARFHSA